MIKEHPFDHIEVLNRFHPTLSELNKILANEPDTFIRIGNEIKSAKAWNEDPRLLPKVTLK